MSGISKDIKAEVLAKVKEGTSVMELSRQYGINHKTIYSWLSNKAIVLSKAKSDRNISKITKVFIADIFSKDLTNSFVLRVSKDQVVKSHQPTPDQKVMDGAPSNNIQKSNVTIAGVDSEKYYAVGPGSATTTIITKADGLIYTFVLDDIYWDNVHKANVDKLYQEMLDSFRLLPN